MERRKGLMVFFSWEKNEVYRPTGFSKYFMFFFVCTGKKTWKYFLKLFGCKTFMFFSGTGKKTWKHFMKILSCVTLDKLTSEPFRYRGWYSEKKHWILSNVFAAQKEYHSWIKLRRELEDNLSRKTSCVNEIAFKIVLSQWAWLCSTHYPKARWVSTYRFFFLKCINLNECIHSTSICI